MTSPARIFGIAFLLSLTGCAVHGHGSADKADVAAAEGEVVPNDAKDVDAEDVETTPEDLGNVNVSRDVSAKEKEADQLSTLTFPLVDNDFVQAWVSFFTGRGRETFERWLLRSTRYIPLMKQVLKEEGVPEDLIYLSMIESGFNPKAYSRAKAVGPWQFIEGTGKRYGLRVDFWIDERKDIVESTHAAARYLKELHAIFGSWYLAAAGYNAGEGRVFNAIRKEKNRNFWELAHERNSFRAETKNYVPKIIAAALVAKNPEKYGFSNTLPFEKPLVWESVKVPGGIDLRAVAQVTGADLETLQILNAELRAGVTPPDSKEGYEVRIMPDKKEILLAKLGELQRVQVASFISHRVGRGENLGYIARRYKTSIPLLLKLNNIRSPRSLRVGQTLKVPLPKGAKGVLPSASTAGSTERSPTKSNRKIASVDRAGGATKHKVRRGETMIGIAKKYHVDVDSLIKENKLKSAQVRIGQRLKIPDNLD